MAGTGCSSLLSSFEQPDINTEKTAARIVLELKNKLAAGINEEISGESHDVEVLETLEALGYQISEVRDVLKSIDTSLSSEEKIKAVLQSMGR